MLDIWRSGLRLWLSPDALDRRDRKAGRRPEDGETKKRPRWSWSKKSRHAAAPSVPGGVRLQDREGEGETTEGRDHPIDWWEMGKRPAGRPARRLHAVTSRCPARGAKPRPWRASGQAGSIWLAVLLTISVAPSLLLMTGTARLARVSGRREEGAFLSTRYGLWARGLTTSRAAPHSVWPQYLDSLDRFPSSRQAHRFFKTEELLYPPNLPPPDQPIRPQTSRCRSHPGHQQQVKETLGADPATPQAPHARRDGRLDSTKQTGWRRPGLPHRAWERVHPSGRASLASQKCPPVLALAGYPPLRAHPTRPAANPSRASHCARTPRPGQKDQLRHFPSLIVRVIRLPP